MVLADQDLNWERSVGDVYLLNSEIQKVHNIVSVFHLTFSKNIFNFLTQCEDEDLNSV